MNEILYFIFGTIFGVVIMLLSAFMLNLSSKKINWDKPIKEIISEYEKRHKDKNL